MQFFSKLVSKVKALSTPVKVIIALSIVGLCVVSLVLVVATLVFIQQLGSNNLSDSTASGEDLPVVSVTPFVTTVVNDTPNCSLPVVEYKESAFSIGVPKGWLYEVEQGTVAIMEDESNTTAAFIYTAKLEQDLSASEFLQQFASIFRQTIEAASGSFQITELPVTTEFATANISALIAEDDLSGNMSVEKSEGFVTLTSYWAPTPELANREGLLKEVTGCFARTRVLTEEVLAAAQAKESDRASDVPGGFAPYTGKYFTLNKPANYSVTGESDSGIDLTRSDGNAGFSYAYVTGMQGAYTPRSWAERALPQYGQIANLSLGSGRAISSPINGQVIEEFDFSGNLYGSIAVKGKVTAGIYNTPYIGFGERYSSAFWGVQIATPEAWEGAKNTLQTIQDSIQIKDIGSTRRNTLLPPNRPMESTGNSLASSSKYSETEEKTSADKWADAMRGYETVESPSTGQRYDVPQNSWSSTGPNGAGYYRQLPDGSLEQLR